LTKRRERADILTSASVCHHTQSPRTVLDLSLSLSLSPRTVLEMAVSVSVFPVPHMLLLLLSSLIEKHGDDDGGSPQGSPWFDCLLDRQDLKFHCSLEWK
jgi:hypothetical protein